jgi:predicted lipoprotein with Yx(FWY)xxD motif
MTTRLKALLATALVVTLLPLSTGSAQDTTAKKQSMMMAGVTVKTTSLGPTLVDAKGMTLYTWGNDTIPGKSACNGQCAANWIPLAAEASAAPMGDWTVVARDDGAKQWAYKGKPLYTYKSDSNAGDVTGNGKGKWAVAQP